MTVPGTRSSAATSSVINITIIINQISHSRIVSNVMTGFKEFTYDMKEKLREKNPPVSNIRTENRST